VKKGAYEDTVAQAML